jgi:hypothetical protein
MKSKRLSLLFVLAVAVALALPAGGSARTLSVSKARTAAQKFLARDHADYPYEPAKQVTTCQRKSKRTVDCAYKAVDSNGTADCGTVRVRLKNARAKRPTVAFHGDPVMCPA